MHDAPVRRVVGTFLIGAFSFALLIFTGIANLALLTSIYPDPQYVGFGMLAFEGGILVWTITYFVTVNSGHKGICVIGIGVDTLISFVGFMYEMSKTTGIALPIRLGVIFVIGGAVLFNISLGLLYKLVPTYSHTVSGFTRFVPADETVTALPEPVKKNG